MKKKGKDSRNEGKKRQIKVEAKVWLFDEALSKREKRPGENDDLKLCVALDLRENKQVSLPRETKRREGCVCICHHRSVKLFVFG